MTSVDGSSGVTTHTIAWVVIAMCYVHHEEAPLMPRARMTGSQPSADSPDPQGEWRSRVRGIMVYVRIPTGVAR